MKKITPLILAASIHYAASLHAVILVPSNGIKHDFFGDSASLSGNNAIVGTSRKNSFTGAAYYFRNIHTKNGTVTEDVKLAAGDGNSQNDYFGKSTSLSGNSALVGAIGKDGAVGAAYFYKDLDTANGTITENVKLTASGGSAFDVFGASTKLFGNSALVGANGVNNGAGAAYFYKDLDTKTGTVTEDVKLSASDAAADDDFGVATSLSGNNALVGANGKNNNSGRAYFFKDLHTKAGTVTEDIILTASDEAAGDNFGGTTSLSGNSALIGANRKNGSIGAAYFYKNLDTQTGTITEDVKLTASDGVAGDDFGYRVSLSGNDALVSSPDHNSTGAVYFFRGLNTKTGDVTENLKITASGVNVGALFGRSVSLDGDRFVIGATGVNTSTGAAYTGTISSMTTLNVGNATRTINGISFVSKEHWIVGETTDRNKVTLSAGDSATVSDTGKSVFIGRNAGSDNNILVIEGNLTGNNVYIGSSAGNAGNQLIIEAGATFDLSDIFLAWDNRLIIEGDYSDSTTLFALFDDTNLQVEDINGNYILATVGNRDTLWKAVYRNGYTHIVPEPETYALILGGLALSGALLRRRFKR